MMKRIKYYGILFLLTVLGLVNAACSVAAQTDTAVAQKEIVTPTAMPTSTPIPTAVADVSPPKSCPITQPPTEPFVPPAPYSAQPPNGEFWYGSNDLWTALWPEGTWQQLPKSEEGYVNKLVWFREGYVWTEEPEPDLTLSARQLDGEAVLEPFMHATNGYHPDYNSFMLTGIELPVLGCWEITGEYDGHSLSFVVWVAP